MTRPLVLLLSVYLLVGAQQIWASECSDILLTGSSFDSIYVPMTDAEIDAQVEIITAPENLAGMLAEISEAEKSSKSHTVIYHFSAYIFNQVGEEKVKETLRSLLIIPREEAKEAVRNAIEHYTNNNFKDAEELLSFLPEVGLHY